MGEPEKDDDIDEALQIKQPNDPIPEPIIEGSESFKNDIKELLNKYIDLLKTEVSKKPASVAPLKLNMDENRWTLPKANAWHRAQSTEKDKEIKRQLELMVALGLIQRVTNRGIHKYIWYQNLMESGGFALIIEI
jgi:hypothetical protein